ncbi:MAG: hypothetical protein LKE40_04755 [Spirochaetia bacterium]|jgi:hypothetical protein|nr:hypothetical protein [Spirochaetia bacterium]
MQFLPPCIQRGLADAKLAGRTVDGVLAVPYLAYGIGLRIEREILPCISAFLDTAAITATYTDLSISFAMLMITAAAAFRFGNDSTGVLQYRIVPHLTCMIRPEATGLAVGLGFTMRALGRTRK